MAAPVVSLYDGPEEALRAAARLFVTACDAAVRARNRFMVSLSGGSTPRALYRLLSGIDGGGDASGAVAWEKVHVFWGDERAVPADAVESNYRMVRESLLDHVPIPVSQIHRIESERPAPEAAARYEQTIRFAFDIDHDSVPSFDLALQGMGHDGHTASLFAGSPLLLEQRRLVAAEWVASINSERITLTPPVLAAARLLGFLVLGADKAAAVARALQMVAPDAQLPAAFVAAQARHVEWILDRAAADGRQAAG